MKNLCTPIFAIASVFYANIALADCASLSGRISWQKIDSNEILIFKNRVPYAKIDLDYGTYISSSSEIQILDDYPCSYSSAVFLIDGEVVDVRRIEKF